MTSVSFCYWLQGLFELQNPAELTPEQTACIKRHLAMVFVHEIDPAMGGKEHQAKLNETHKDPFHYTIDQTGTLLIRC